jgi:hypothetical protein
MKGRFKLIYDNIEKIGAITIKQIEKEIENEKKQNKFVEPAEMKFRGIYDDCHVIVTIELKYTPDE